MGENIAWTLNGEFETKEKQVSATDGIYIHFYICYETN